MGSTKLRSVPTKGRSEAAETAGPSKVVDRIRSRIQVLKLWLATGIPQDQLGCVPTSLRQAARWNAPQHGIVRIASPNDFTKTHADWGEEVSKVDTLLRELHSRYRTPQKKKPATTVAAEARTKSGELALVLKQVTSQWQAADHAAKSAADAMGHKDALIADLEAQVAAKDTELASLRRELSALKAARRLHST